MMLLAKRLWVQLTSDRKRFGALCGLAALGLLLWARIIVISDMPRHAVAEPEATITAPEPAQEAVQETDKRGELSVVLSDQPGRDPFVISTRHFPPLELTPDFDNGGKSVVQTSEDSDAGVDSLATQLREMAERLRLEAVVMSESPMAIISGKTHREGDEIRIVGFEEPTFVLEAIRERSIVLTSLGHSFELKMNLKSP